MEGRRGPRELVGIGFPWGSWGALKNGFWGFHSDPRHSQRDPRDSKKELIGARGIPRIHAKLRPDPEHHMASIKLQSRIKSQSFGDPKKEMIVYPGDPKKEKKWNPRDSQKGNAMEP